MPSDLKDQNLTDPCADIQAQLAAYALGEVDADIDILAHLSMCSACQEDLRAYVQVAWMLAHEAPDAAPPPGLRERILAAAAESQLAAQATVAAKPAPAPELSQMARERQRLAPASQRSRGLFVPRPAFALATLVFLVLLGWNIVLQSQLFTQSALVAEDRQTWQRMIVLLNDPAVQRYQMVGSGANGRLWAAPQNPFACLVTQGLPKLDGQHMYQVWLIHGQEHDNGGRFDSFNGNGWVLIRGDKPMSNYEAVGVTVESRDGSDVPTSATVLQGALTASEKPSAYERQETLSMLALVAHRRD
jgi:anti-sigma-K factor RskA